MRGFQHVGVTPLPIKCATCAEMRLREMLGVGVGPKGLAGEGQPIHSMRLVRREVPISAQVLPPQVRAFVFTFLFATLVLIVHSIPNKYVTVLFIFFSSAG
jgi:hypothetical protein